MDWQNLAAEPARPGDVVWKTDLGPGNLSSPATDAGANIYVIITGASPGNASMAVSSLAELSADQGTSRWARPLGDMAIGDPLVTPDGDVVVAVGDRTCSRFAPDGTFRWRVSIEFVPATSPALGSNGEIVVAGRTLNGSEVYPSLLSGGRYVFERRRRRLHGAEPA